MSPAPRGRGGASAQVRDDGSIQVGRVVVAADDVAIRTTTSSGPGGQHANRSRTRVVATLDIANAVSLDEAVRSRLLDVLGPVVRSSAGRFRSQSMNRAAALEQLGVRLAAALAPVTPRRDTKPTRASRERRLDDKRARSRLKSQRRAEDD
ncbi:MAG TPA: aminoacyl-tRNA hydrolase [Acidimicrobiales bacterium]|nr:aminoacyl-tRNA hydrolase [Acidimicrobiales bacterium]